MFVFMDSWNWKLKIWHERSICTELRAQLRSFRRGAIMRNNSREERAFQHQGLQSIFLRLWGGLKAVECLCACHIALYFAVWCRYHLCTKSSGEITELTASLHCVYQNPVGMSFVFYLRSRFSTPEWIWSEDDCEVSTRFYRTEALNLIIMLRWYRILLLILRWFRTAVSSNSCHFAISLAKLKLINHYAISHAMLGLSDSSLLPQRNLLAKGTGHSCSRI